MTILDIHTLSNVSGGAGAGPSPEQQKQMRDLAERYCPSLASKHRNGPITRPLAEQCMDEAGLGMFKGRLDKYFPK